MNLEDAAQHHETLMWEQNNKPLGLTTHQPHEPGYGPQECTKCGDDMPTLRREMGKRLCTRCQSELERVIGRR